MKKRVIDIIILKNKINDTQVNNDKFNLVGKIILRLSFVMDFLKPIYNDFREKKDVLCQSLGIKVSKEKLFMDKNGNYSITITENGKDKNISVTPDSKNMHYIRHDSDKYSDYVTQVEEAGNEEKTVPVFKKIIFSEINNSKKPNNNEFPVSLTPYLEDLKEFGIVEIVK